MTKEEFVNRIVCEHWFGFISWKGKKWDDNKKSIWLSGMHESWNILRPSEHIEPSEVVMKVETWSREEAQQWYDEYISQTEKDEGRIENRFEILDLRDARSHQGEVSRMTKEEFVNIIICEYWFGFISWKGKEWDDKKKSIWLSGMNKAWNIIRPSEKIEGLDIYKKRTKWKREEAEQWYIEYHSEEEEDDGRIENRWQMLDIRKPPSLES